MTKSTSRRRPSNAVTVKEPVPQVSAVTPNGTRSSVLLNDRKNSMATRRASVASRSMSVTSRRASLLPQRRTSIAAGRGGSRSYSVIGRAPSPREIIPEETWKELKKVRYLRIPPHLLSDQSD